MSGQLYPGQTFLLALCCGSYASTWIFTKMENTLRRMSTAHTCVSVTGVVFKSQTPRVTVSNPCPIPCLDTEYCHEECL